MIERFAQWITRNPWLVIAITIVAVGLVASGGKRLVMSSDYRVFFSEDNPYLQAFEDLQDTYSKNDNVLFILAPKSGTVFSERTLTLLKKLTKDAYQIPLSTRIDSITNFQHTYAEGEDDLLVEDLVGRRVKLTDDKIAKIKQIALNEPLLVHRLISPSGHVAAVNVTISMPSPPTEGGVEAYAEFTRNTQHQVATIAGDSRAMAAKIRAEYPEIDVYLTGMAIMNQTFPEVAQHDAATLIPVMFAFVLMMVGFLLRSFISVLGCVLVILLSIASAMGVAGWADILLSPPALSAPTMILTLAVADCVHLLSGFLHKLRQGFDRKASVIACVNLNFQPIMLTSLTTAIGFLSMNFSDAPPFRDMGNIVAVGVVVAFILSVTLLPALLTVLPIKPPKKVAEPSVLIDRFANWVIAQNKLLFWVGTIMAIGAMSFIMKNELNDEFVKYFSEDVPFRVSSEFSSDNLAGLYTIHYSIESGREGGVNGPEFMSKVDEWVQWLRLQPEVEHVNTVSDIIKRLNMNMHADKSEFHRIPGDEEEMAQFFLLYEMSLRRGMDLNNQIDQAKSSTRVAVTVKNLSTNQLLALEERVQQWMVDNMPEVMRTDGTGSTMMFAHIGERNIKSMLIGTSVALVLISVILIFALKSLPIGLLSLVPNLVPPLVGFGLWGLFVGQVGLGLSIVAGMTLGIVVDDTVHFLYKYMHAKREMKMTATEAVHYAFHTVGSALVVTTIVLIVGFLVLATSDFAINADMGLLTAVVIGIALVADFLLLPPLLIKLGDKRV